MRTKRCGYHVPAALTGAMTMVFVLMLSGSTLWSAQPTQPASDDNSGPATAGGPGGGGGGAGDYRPGSPGMGLGADASRGYGNDYPAAEVQAVPVARAEAARARAEMELVQTRLHRWIDRTWDDFVNSRDYLDASNAEKRAAEQYEKERKRVLARLNEDSSYRALIDLIEDLRAKIDRGRPKGKVASMDEADGNLALATLKLGYASTASAMEAAALNADQGVQDARSKLMDAANRTRQMRHDFDRTVRHDPQFLASQANIDQARINRMVSATFLEGAINAREIALDYTYYVHRWDQYKYSVYGLYGYGTYGGYGRYGSGGGYPPVLPVDYYSGPYMRR